MSAKNVRHLRSLLALLALAVMAVVGCGDGDGGGNGNPAGPAVFPASWAGVWDLEGTVTICDTDSIVDTIAERDTICTGEAFEFDLEEGFVLDCTGTITDTHADIECTGTFTFGGATCMGTVQVTATRNNDEFTSMITANVTCTGSGEVPPDFCLHQEITATRVSLSQPGCDGGSPAPWLRLRVPDGTAPDRMNR